MLVLVSVGAGAGFFGGSGKNRRGNADPRGAEELRLLGDIVGARNVGTAFPTIFLVDGDASGSPDRLEVFRFIVHIQNRTEASAKHSFVSVWNAPYGV